LHSNRFIFLSNQTRLAGSITLTFYLKLKFPKISDFLGPARSVFPKNLTI